MADTADFLSSIYTQAALGVKFQHGGCVELESSTVGKNVVPCGSWVRRCEGYHC